MAHLGKSLAPSDAARDELEELVTAILVAPDRALGEMYRLKLEMDGYQVAIVDYDEVINQLHSGLPDILFLDIRDAERDDAARYDTVAHDPKTCRLPIVLLSHRRASELARLGVGIRSVDFVIREPPAFRAH